MFPHPRPDVRALDASASIPPSEEAIPCAFILFTFFTLFQWVKRVTKRWNSNVFAYTFTLVPLSRGKSTFQNPSQPLESLGFLTLSELVEEQKSVCSHFNCHGPAAWDGDPMSKRRRFGSIAKRTAKNGRKYVQARYQPPIWAYSKWPDLPKHYTKNFDAEYTAMAEAWLAEQERLIKLGSWEPPRIEEVKGQSSTITFREYALDFVQRRKKPNGQRIAPTTREKYLQYLDDYLLPVLGDNPMGSIGPRDVERWADSMRVGKAGEGASVKHKAYVLLREIFRDACERELDSDGTTLIKSNPVHIRMYKPTTRFQYVDISMEELNTLYHAMPQRFAVVVYLSGVMGLRPGEVYGLQRRDVRLKDDLSGGVLDIVRAAKEYSPKDPETGKRHKKVLVNETKSIGSIRHPPIPGFICKALDLHLRTFVPDNPTAFLFTGPRTCEVVNAQTVRNAWYRARKSVPRLEEKKVSLYNLRHRAISHMKAYTNSDKTVMEFAGHERLDTDRHYQHAVETERRRIISGMENDARGTITSVPGNDASTLHDAGSASSEIARLLEKTDVATRITFLKAMNASEREEVMRQLSSETKEETLSRMLA